MQSPALLSFGCVILKGELLGEKLLDCEDWNSLVAIQIQQVRVSRYDAGNMGYDGAAKKNVIVRIGDYDGITLRYFKHGD